MADSKITALTALTAADPVNDMFPVVDVSDTSMAASGTTKRISVNNILSSSPTASGALTVTGLVTAGSATITGAATVGTTLSVTGVSTFAAGTALLPALTTTGDTNTGIYYPAADTFAVTTAGVERYRVDSSGNVSVALGNVVMATSGKGIDFSATANSSGTMTSELLNDYEEGTWVGTLAGLTTSPTVAVTTTGRYTKIGREVKVSIYFQGVSTVGASGIIRITGLPFTSANDGVGSIGTFSSDLAATFTGYVVAALGGNSTIIEFASTQSNGAAGFATHNAGLNRYVAATLMYNV